MAEDKPSMYRFLQEDKGIDEETLRKMKNEKVRLWTSRFVSKRLGTVE